MSTPGWQIIEGDCIDVMRTMDAESVHAVVCDPPYLINFMGRSFDSQHNSADARSSGLSEGQRMQVWHERWTREVLRVLRPGGYLLAFGGTRSAHRLACAIEDAGFEIRDRILSLSAGGDAAESLGPELDWIYGSG